MDFEKVIDNILKIQEKVDVNSFKFRNIHIWPMVRLLIWVSSLNPSRNFNTSDDTNFRFLKIKFTQKGKEFLNRASGRYVGMFFCMYYEYQYIIDSKHYNPQVDSFISQFSNALPLVKTEFYNSDFVAHEPRFYPSLPLVCDHSYRPARFSNVYRIKNYEKLHKAILETLGFPLDERCVVEWMCFVMQYSRLFEQCLSRLGVKVVFLSCYYHVIGMGLVLACRRMGIPCVEYQHGMQGPCHGLYSHWTSLPSSGYDLVPDWFWTWGEQARHNIESWFPPEQNRHHSVVGGNLWLRSWRNGHVPETASHTQAIVKTIGKRKAILVSLQPLDDPLPNFVREAIRQSSDEWLWLLRSHPFFMEKLAPHMKSLALEHPRKVEWRVASSAPLFSLLKRCHHHISCFSTVCYEAQAFDITTTIVHPTGKKLFDAEIKSGAFHYAEDAASLLSSISIGTNLAKHNQASPYIETSLDKATQALNNVLISSRITQIILPHQGDR